MILIDKYRPKKLSEIKGQDKPISDFKRLVEDYRKGKAIMIHGGHGTGKTISVHALANELNLELIEINASDFRNKEGMENKILNAVKQGSLFGKNKLILIDDADSFGTSDRGGLNVIPQIIEKSIFPVVMTVRDPWERKISRVRRASHLVGFRSLSHVSIFNFLNDICLKEKFGLEKDVLMEIAKKNEGDLRGAINDLESYSEDLGSRERGIDVFSVLKKVFKNRDENVGDVLNEMSISFDDYLMWVDENIGREYSGEELKKAYDRLSKADVFRGRIRRWQYYRFFVYQMFLMSVGVSFAKKEEKFGFTNYQKPGRILKMFIAKQRYGKKRAIAELIANKIHCSTKRVLDSFDDYIGLLRNEEVIRDLELNGDEIDWLKNAQRISNIT